MSATVAVAALTLAALPWIVLVLRLGAWRISRTPGTGVFAYTFDGWHQWPATAHLFLGQYQPTDFARGIGYASYPYPYLLTAYAIVAPIHFVLRVPFGMAQNVLPYVYVGLFLVLVGVVARVHIGALLETLSPARIICLILAAGFVATTPAAWSATLLFGGDNVHVGVALVFCALSMARADGVRWRAYFFGAGMLLALYAPLYGPAWLLARLTGERGEPAGRPLVRDALGVGALSLLSAQLPTWVARLGEIRPVRSSYAYRSGLDGARDWLRDLPQAILWPPADAYAPYQRISLAVHLAAVAVALFALPRLADPARRTAIGRRIRGEAGFLAIPYLSMAILFPQATSIHPYYMDVLLLVPSGFLLALWTLRAETRPSGSGPALTGWILLAAFVLMTDLLHLAQAFRLSP